jgi:hypothetical protein
MISQPQAVNRKIVRLTEAKFSLPAALGNADNARATATANGEPVSDWCQKPLQKDGNGCEQMALNALKLQHFSITTSSRRIRRVNRGPAIGG